VGGIVHPSIRSFHPSDKLHPPAATKHRVDSMKKYRAVPMSVADACLVRMTETIPNPLVRTTDADFLVYRRHGRQVVPCITP
jgi:hypothetical protein